MRFVDTNVLLYAVGTSDADRAKAETARALLDQEDLALSAQVLQEFYLQATRPSRPDPPSHKGASQLIKSFLRFPIQEITVEIVHAATEIHQQFQISYWDAAILKAARTLGCNAVLSEDLNDGQDHRGVVVARSLS